MPRSAGLARLAGLLILVALLVLPTSHANAAPKPELPPVISMVEWLMCIEAGRVVD